MKAEKMYEEVLKLESYLDDESRKIIEKLVESHNKLDVDFKTQIANILIDLKEEIIQECAKENGKDKTLKVMKDILKKSSYNYNHYSNYAYVKDGFTYVCDGIRLLKIKGNFDFPKIKDDFIKFYDNLIERFFEVYVPTTEILLPKVPELKSYIKMKKAENKTLNIRTNFIIYNFGENKPSVNAEALLSMLEALPKCKAFNDSTIAPIYFENDKDMGVMMGIKK